MPVCPTGASYKRKKDGIVLVDYDKCIGCKYCAWACPYGARELDEERQVMTKCTLCVDRIYDERLPKDERKPACVMACPTGARLFGDVKDPDSEVSQGDPRARRLPADAGVGNATGQPVPAAAHHAAWPATANEPGLVGRVLHHAGGAAQGLVVTLALAVLAALPMSTRFLDTRAGAGSAVAGGGAGRVVPAPRPAGARLARGDDVAHVVAVARGHRAAGLHRRVRAVVAGAAPGLATCRWLPLAALALAAAALVLHRDDLRLHPLHPGVGASADRRQLHPHRAGVGPGAGLRAGGPDGPAGLAAGGGPIALVVTLGAAATAGPRCATTRGCTTSRRCNRPPASTRRI